MPLLHISQSTGGSNTATQLTMRKQIDFCLQAFTFILLACLLVAASQHQYFSTKFMVQSIGSVELNVITAKPSTRAHTGKVFPTWVEWKKLRRAPSGPNPVGNQHPPSRH
ncbi:CLAVATA3/ESR (CLE)-related protein 46-like [Mangifera indica]|uniref:CLAVATA3/ESR (CLE)-related protein 46-like n=1 Tax=Mangifera indica TaxID=29780 RepID=UPI001CFA58C7|nr:CLAVATA3/ESR (CLE)-related protein 46-like [Mangifera indica]